MLGWRKHKLESGIKIAGRITNDLRYADDTTLMAEGEELLLRASWWKWKMLGAVLGITDKMEAWSPVPSHSAGMDPGMKELGLVILTCLFLSLAELTEKEY